jgi:hypothetical protein
MRPVTFSFRVVLACFVGLGHWISARETREQKEEEIARETRERRRKKETGKFDRMQRAMLAPGEERVAGVATAEVHQAILSQFPFRVFSRVSRASFSFFSSRLVPFAGD